MKKLQNNITETNVKLNFRSVFQNESMYVIVGLNKIAL